MNDQEVPLEYNQFDENNNKEDNFQKIKNNHLKNVSDMSINNSQCESGRSIRPSLIKHGSNYSSRRDSLGNVIDRTNGKKKHRIQFKKGDDIEEVHEVASYKKYNIPKEGCQCCNIF